MDFEIIEQLHDIETIAVHTSIYDLDRLKKITGRDDGASLKESRVCEDSSQSALLANAQLVV